MCAKQNFVFHIFLTTFTCRMPKTLLSLAELWSDGEGQSAKYAGDTKLLQKYEEERCRRQVCVWSEVFVN